MNRSQSPFQARRPTRTRAPKQRRVGAFLIAVTLGGIFGYTLRGGQATAPNTTPSQTLNTTRPAIVPVSIIGQRGLPTTVSLKAFPMWPDPYDQYDGLVLENPTDQPVRAYAQLVLFHETIPVAVRLERTVLIPARTWTELRFESVGRDPHPTHAVLFLRPAR